MNGNEMDPITDAGAIAIELAKSAIEVESKKRAKIETRGHIISP